MYINGVAYHCGLQTLGGESVANVEVERPEAELHGSLAILRDLCNTINVINVRNHQT
jgi:hypothetical protein